MGGIAFGGVEIGRVPHPDGRLVHAAVTINGSTVMLNDDFPDFNDGKSTTPKSLGGTPVTIHLQVTDVEAAFKRAVDAGATVALATDCNPGSSFTSSMPFCIALAVREMRMTTDEAVWAATAGGARALRRTDIGHLGVGARADLILLDAPSHAYLAYRPGVPQIAAVWQAGTLVAGAVP